MTSADRLMPPSVQWMLMAVAGYSIGSVFADPLWSVTATAVATIFVLFGILRPRELRVGIHLLGGTLALLTILLADSQGIARFPIQPESYDIWFLFAVATAVAVLFARGDSMRFVTIVLALSTVVVSSLAVLVPDWEPSASSDVFRAHTAAGDALLSGENPYSSAVTFESGDPNKPDGTSVEGYPYPPPPLLTYALVGGITDARVISVVSWLAVALGLAVIAARRGPLGSVSVVVLALLATVPVWRMALFMSWTEPLSVALVGASLIGISKRRRWGWIVLGVALASKQYLVFLAPLVLLYRDEDGRRPGWVAIAVSALVAGFPALFGPSDYIKSIIGNTLSIGFRPDTQSINGAVASLGSDFLIPMVVVLPVIAVLFYAVFRMSLSGALLPAAGVVILATAFLITSAFPNYWMLVTALAGMASIVAVSNDEDRRGEAPADSSREMEIAPPGKQIPEDPVPGDSR